MNFFNNKLLFTLGCVYTLLVMQTLNAQTTNCNTIACIQNAMATAQPGDEIVIASGTYIFQNSDKIPGAFGRNAYLHSNRNGTSVNRITLRGASETNPPVIQGIDYIDGYLLGLEGNYWTIKDIEFRTGSKGVILDDADFTELINLEIHDVGEEALHFRHGTTDSVADNCFIHETGRTPSKRQFGEGIYIGSDRSVHNLPYNDTDAYCSDSKREMGRCGRFYNPDVNNITVKNCTIGPNVTAEHFDVREGTCQIFIEGNTMDASGLVKTGFEVSFIDLKGSYCYVRNNNVFNQNGENDIRFAIQIIPRDDNKNLITATERYNVIHGNTFNMDDGNTEIIGYFNEDSNTFNYAYDNIRNPEGKLYTNDIIDSEAPNFGSVDCPNDADQYSDLALSVLGFTKSKSLPFSITPNPVDRSFTITELDSIKTVAVYDMQGRKMPVKVSVDSLTNVDVSTLSPGVYILRIETERGLGVTLFSKL